MRKHTTLTQLRLAQRARFEQIGTSLHTVHYEQVQMGKKDFEELTSGKIPAKLIDAIHPFARSGGQGTATGRKLLTKRQRSKAAKIIGGRGSIPLNPINIRTGQVHKGIRLTRGSNQHEFDLYSIAPHAKYVLAVGGTKKMVARDVLGPNGQLRKRHRMRAAAAVDVMRRRQQAVY